MAKGAFIRREGRVFGRSVPCLVTEPCAAAGPLFWRCLDGSSVVFTRP